MPHISIKWEKTNDFIKVKFEALKLKKPSRLPVIDIYDDIFDKPVIITNKKNNNNNNNNNVSNVKYNEVPPYNTNVKSVTKLGNSFMHNGKKIKHVEFNIKKNRMINVSFENFLKVYPNVYFLQDYISSREVPSILELIVKFLKSTDVTEKIKLSDLKKVFKLFFMKDICIFKIIGEIKETPNVEKIRTFLKKKIQKYIDNTRTIDKLIWENSDYSNLGGLTSGRKWTVVYNSDLFSNEQLKKIATHNAAKSRAPKAYAFYLNGI